MSVRKWEPIGNSQRAIQSHRCVIENDDGSDIMTEVKITIHLHGALLRAIAEPMIDMVSEASMVGGTALSMFLPEPRRKYQMQNPITLGDSDSVFIPTPHGVRVHAKILRKRAIMVNKLHSNSFDALCLHGALGSAFCFRNLLPGLAHALGGSVAAYDRPPFGLSELTKGTKFQFGLQEEAALTLSTARALGLQVRTRRLVLVGHSLGGAVALRTALNIPTAIGGLVLLAPALSVAMPGAAFSAVRAALAVPPIGRRFVREHFRAMAKEERLQRRFGDNTDIREGYIRPLRRAGWDEEMRSYLQSFGGYSLWDLEKQLQALAVPTLIVAAASDSVVGEASLERLSHTLPNATFIRIPNTSHLMFEDNPAAVLHAISEWARRNLHADNHS